MNGEFQKHNSSMDYNFAGLHHSNNSNVSGGWKQSVADHVWSYTALFLGMIILGIFFLIDERLEG